MAKIKVSADAVLAILKGIMNDEDINSKITDKAAPEDWQGKSIQEVLNVDYYTFRHRPMDTELLINEIIKQGQDTNALYALTRSFCILSLKSTERVYSKENDIVTVSANLEYWIQTDKVKLLEDMLENIIVESTGIRVPVKIGSEEREVLIAIGKLIISELQETSEFGEMAVCDVDIDMVFYPPAISRADYRAEFALTSDDITTWVSLPFSSLTISNSMTQKAVPKANKVRSVGNINLSRAKTFTFTFDGYKNKFIDKLVSDTFAGDIDSSGNEVSDKDNNESIVLRLTRGEEQFFYDCIVKEHTVTVQEDTGNETHALTLTTRGIKNGST